MKICRDCETKYDKEEFCPECGGDELWNPDVDDPDWFKPDSGGPMHEDRGIDEQWEREI